MKLRSYSMRHFIAAYVKHLKEQTVSGVPLFEAQMFTMFCMHTDNAAQHFQELEVSQLAFAADARDGAHVCIMGLRGTGPRQSNCTIT